MDYQGIGMITVFLILVTLFVWSIMSKTSGYKYRVIRNKNGNKYINSGGIKMRIK